MSLCLGENDLLSVSIYTLSKFSKQAATSALSLVSSLCWDTAKGENLGLWLVKPFAKYLSVVPRAFVYAACLYLMPFPLISSVGHSSLLPFCVPTCHLSVPCLLPPCLFHLSLLILASRSPAQWSLSKVTREPPMSLCVVPKNSVCGRQR